MSTHRVRTLDAALFTAGIVLVLGTLLALGKAGLVPATLLLGLCVAGSRALARRLLRLL
ncbi:MAG: hypothetical protein K8H88_02050 [Sandaracinaceae bacterium]|nr:hypothetical protein [Sandaracinaceae bacterium]